MHDAAAPTPELVDSLAEGIAAVIAAGEELAGIEETPGDLADLFLEELNRLWAEPLPEGAPAPLPRD